MEALCTYPNKLAGTRARITHLEKRGDAGLCPAVLVSIILKQQGSNVRMS